MKVRWGHLVVACGAVLTQAAVQSAPGQSPAPVRPSPVASSPRTSAPALARSTTVEPPSQAFVNTYCATCHNQRVKAGGLALDTLDLADVGAHGAEWEKVVVKLRAGLMPPAGMPRPEQAVIDGFATSLEGALDRAAAAKPNPGRTEPFHRLNRAEYQNAIRDLLDLEVDATTWLPTDEISYGFDNIAGVLKLSPLLTERYLNAAQKVARLALGTPAPPNGDLFRVPDQLDQDVRLEGMPVGTRGGTRVDYLASRDGDYVHQGPPEPRHRLRHPVLHRRAAARNQRGRGANQGLHRAGHARRSAQLRATGGPARPLASGPGGRSAQPREPARGGNGPQQPRRRLDRAGAAHGWRARDPRHVPDEDRRRVGGLPQAVPQAVHRPRHRRRTRDARGRGAARDGSHGAAESRRRRHAAELPEGLRLPPGGPVRGDRLCPDGAVEAGAARVSPPGHRRRHRRPDELLSRGPGCRHLRHRRRAGAAAHPHQPLVPLPHRVRARLVQRRLPHQRPRAGLAPVVLPVEQHPRRRAAGPGREEPAPRARRDRAADTPDAGRPALRGVHLQLRRAVAVAAAAAGHRPRSVPLSRLRRHAGAGVPPRSRALLRQHRPRGPAGARPADGRTTPSSTSVWRSTTASRTSRASTSGGSRWPTTARGAVCWARARS